MFKGFKFKAGNSKKDCCSISIEEVKDDKQETSECCEEQTSCCS